eukprot:5884990-Amphidinium_carterae.3
MTPFCLPQQPTQHRNKQCPGPCGFTQMRMHEVLLVLHLQRLHLLATNARPPVSERSISEINNAIQLKVNHTVRAPVRSVIRLGKLLSHTLNPSPSSDNLP